MQSIAGYRLVRELTRGDRSEVHLAHDAEGRTVVVRILPSAATDERDDAFAEDVDSDHVLPVIDIATLDDGRIMTVTPRIAGGTLGAFVADRPHLSAGECVTAIVAIARGLRALHDAGWCHGRLDLSNVLLTTNGTPVLAGLGHARPLDEVRRESDREQLTALASKLLQGVTGAEELTASHGGIPLAPEVLERRAIAFAQPVPLIRRGETEMPASGTQWRRDLHFDLMDDEPSGSQQPLAWMRAVIRERVDVRAVLNAVTSRARASTGQVRRRTWITAIVAATALLVALALVPRGGDTNALAQQSSPAPSTVPDSTTAGGATEAPVPAETEVVMPDSDATESDDPLAALQVLIDRRQRCFAALSTECLADVNQEGSAAAENDLATVQRMIDGAVIPPRIELGDGPFVQRTGDSALVAGETVSVLLVRGAEGWRIRDFFDVPA